MCDFLGSEGKWRNLQKRRLADFVAPADLARWLTGRKLDAVFHMGAISETTATDGDLVIDTNFRLPLMLLDWCAETRMPLIYASSAATYGDGEEGFADDNSLEALTRLKPMNLYGWSKHLFDLAVIERARNGGKPAAAMGGPEVLQRVRAQRVSQGRDDEPRRQALRATPRPACRCGCSSRTATASPTASSGAISSMWTTPSR